MDINEHDKVETTGSLPNFSFNTPGKNMSYCTGYHIHPATHLHVQKENHISPEGRINLNQL